MVNWDYLKDNMTTLDLTNVTTQLQDVDNVVITVLDNADTVSQGYFGLSTMIIIFIVLLVVLYDKSGDMKLNILSSIMIASGFSSIVGTVLIIINVASSWVHVMYFVVVFIVSTISLYLYNNKK